jgi:EAL and modified HD-GYP domain-containing signal transduction protein
MLAEKLAGLNTLATINDPSLTFERLERIIADDVGLTYKLLRYINSGFFSLSRRVETVHDALTLLGMANVRQWATVMALAGASTRPPALITLALLRARLCQRLAAESDEVPEGVAFMAGLLSVLDALLDVSMEQAVARLSLSDDLTAALLSHQGRLGELLERVIAIEGGSLEVLEAIGPTAYVEASGWADDATRAAAA